MEALDAARQHRGTVLVLRGRAGLGKSSLLAQAASRAGDMEVLRCRGIASEAGLPFGSLHQLLRPVLPNLVRLPGPQADALRGAFGLQPASSADRFLVSLATLTLLAETAERRPLLCLLDDAHWFDPASAEALLFAARRLEAEAVLLLFAARDEDDVAFEAPDLPSIELDELDGTDARRILDRASGVPVSPNVTEEILRVAGGNPLAITEIAGALSEEQLRGTAALPDHLPVAGETGRVFAARLDRLSSAARAMLLVAAADTTGRASIVTDAARRLGVDPAAFDELERTGVVSAAGSEVAVRHPLLRSAAYDGASYRERRAAHAALAEVLGGPGHLDHRVWHRAAATDPPDPALSVELGAAGDRATRRSAHAGAAAAYERAAAFAQDDGARGEMLVRAARSAWNAGDQHRTDRLCREAVAFVDDPVLLADVALLQGLVELASGSVGVAHDLLARAAAEVSVRDPGRSAELLLMAGEAASLSGERAANTRLVPVAQQLESIATGETAAAATLIRGLALHFDEDSTRGTPLVARALDALRSTQVPRLLAAAGRAALYLGQDELAYRHHSTAASRARSAGAVGELPLILTRLAISGILAGRFATAAAHAEESVRLARETGKADFVGHPTAWLALLAALQGEDDEHRRHVDSARRSAAARSLGLVQDSVAWAVATHDGVNGRWGAAHAALIAIEHPVIRGFAGMEGMTAAAEVGDLTALERWTGEAEAILRSQNLGWARLRVAYGRTLQAGGASWEAVLDVLDGSSTDVRPFERARVALVAGRGMRRARRRVDSREPLRIALREFEALGALPWAGQARHELRASGERIASSPASARPSVLTPQELQVARYVASGLSNRDVGARLFLSPRTIDFHLRNVFVKLGIASRAELSRFELGPLGEEVD